MEEKKKNVRRAGKRALGFFTSLLKKGRSLVGRGFSRDVKSAKFAGL